MAPVAQPFVEILDRACAGFAEGHAVLSEVSDPKADASRLEVQFAWQNFVTGFTQLEALARRYMSTPEYITPAQPRPILLAAILQAAASRCAEGLDTAAPSLGTPGKRIAATLRRWIAGDPSQASVLFTQCDAASRLAKMKAGRAA